VLTLPTAIIDTKTLVMRFTRHILLVLVIAVLASCNKGSTQNNKTETFNGRLWPKGTTSYNYGTHLVFVDKFTAYLVKSTSITLDSYNGDSVRVVVKDMGIRENPGPELYNVIEITPL